MEFKLNFNMDAAAFDESPEFESREILKHVGRQVIDGATYANIYDVSGNKIGFWEIDPH